MVEGKDENNMCCHWFGGYGGFRGIGMIFGILLFLALIVGAIFLVIWLVRREGTINNRRTNLSATSSSLEIARERYAKGEISREEYQNLVSDLEKR